MSDVVFGIPPEVLLTRASESSVLPDLYFLFYRTASAACQDMSEVIVRAQVIQFGCLWNAVDKGTCFGSSCCVMEHPGSPFYVLKHIKKKNWQVIDTINGAKTFAVIYSIAETVKSNNLKPYEYFKYLLTVIPEHMEDTA